MKTSLEIQAHIDELSGLLPKGSYELAYLRMALEKDEPYLNHLLRKYEFELQEDSEIVRALRWVLELDESQK